MIDIVRDQHAGDVPDVILPIPVIGTLKTTNNVIGWIIPIAAALGAIALLLGIFTRPDRRDVLRGLGEFGLAMAVLDDRVRLPDPGPPVDRHRQRHLDAGDPAAGAAHGAGVIGTTAIFGLAGLALILASTSGGKRRQFSTPLSVARYRGGDNPGWS